MTYEERKVAILKALATFDNLGRVKGSKGVVDYAELREQMGFTDFFWLIRDLHLHFLIDATIPDEELENNPDDPQSGTVEIRPEGIEFLKTH